MALISKEVIDKIRSDTDIVDLIGSYIPLTNKGKNFFCVCPFHDDHSPSMSVSREKQIYSCFSCGATGNVFTFLMNYENMSFVDAVRFLGEKQGIKIAGSKPKINEKFKEFYDIYNTAVLYYKNNLNSNLGEEARKYLYNRGLNDEDIKYFNIGLSLNNNNLVNSLVKKHNKEKLIEIGLAYEKNGNILDLYKNRIMFSITDLNGNFCAFSGRIYNTSEGSKYINTKGTPIFKKSNVLYNYSNAKDIIKKKKEIIICEGFMDVIRLHTIGIKNSVALMGTSFTDEQFEFIKRLKCNVVLNLDRDDAGESATYTIGKKLLENDIPVKVIVYSGAKDSDEYVLKFGSEAFLKNYNNKINFIDFEIEYLKKNKNLNDTVELSKYINEVITSLNDINDDILLDLKIKELVSKYGISEEVIFSKIKKKPKKKKVVVKKEEDTLKYNKYDVSEIRIIYLMLNYKEVISEYENKLGYLVNKKRKDLANSIIYFKEKNHGFNYADFITFISDKQDLLETFNEVNNYHNIKTYTERELEDYFKNVKENMIETQVEKLKKQMSESLDINEKLNILKRIEKIKKDVLEW